MSISEKDIIKEVITMLKTFTPCPVEYTASIISNKWKVLILK